MAAVLPRLLGEQVPHLAGAGITRRSLVIGYLVLAPVGIASALISQRMGRRPFLIAAGVLMAVINRRSCSTS
ncbi:hypothetical protein HBB16_01555 [Pseudonocardia sp. MCCB 268]|nr:hypothetical protein [Pseudonocardia cytotoxica]